MTARKTTSTAPSGEELGLKLLQSVREMKVRKFARVTEVEVNEVAQALIRIARKHPEVVHEALA